MLELKSLYPASKRNVVLFIVFLSCFETLVYLGVDLVLPAMLIVVRDMEAPNHHVANAFNSYLLGGVVFQWLIGALSDRFGRRPLLIYAMLFFSLTFLTGAITKQIEWFNFFRFLQGTSIGFIMVVVYPMIQEFFEEGDAVRLMALLSSIALISPLIGPLLGSLLMQWFSWREIFTGMGIAALLILVSLWRCIPETLGMPRKDGRIINPVPLSLRGTLRCYWKLWNESQFICGSLVLGLLSAPLIAWIGMSPLLVMGSLEYSQSVYVILQLPVFSGVIIGTFLLNKLANYYQLGKLLYFSFFPIFIGIFGFFLLSFSTATLPSFILFLFIYATGLGLGSSILYRLTLFTVPGGYGYVAAMLGMLSTAVVSITIALLTFCDAAADLSGFALGISLPIIVSVIPLCIFLAKRNAEKITT